MGKQDIFIAVGFIIFSIFGACVKWLNAKNREPQQLFPLLSETASAAFSGGLIFCLYAWLNFNVYLSFCLAGVVGGLGTRGIDILSGYIADKSGFAAVKEAAAKKKDE